MTMKKYMLSLILLGLFSTAIFAQDAEEKDKPVTGTFESGYLIDAQTSAIPDARTLEFAIQHKFGTMDNGISDLWGIYAPGANVRLALNYVPFKNFQVGIGQTKNYMYTDFNAKWNVLQQTEKNSMPVTVTLFGSVAIDGRDYETLGTGQIVTTKGPTLPEYMDFQDRFSYFSQLIISRKFTDKFSVQAGASFTHYNMAGWDYNHDIVGVHAAGRLKVSPQSSLIVTYDHPLKIKNISEQWTWDTHPKPNLAVGIEIFTFTHAFQIYAGTSDGIIPQHIMMYNSRDWKDGLSIGFTITRLWMF